MNFSNKQNTIQSIRLLRFCLSTKKLVIKRLSEVYPRNRKKFLFKYPAVWTSKTYSYSEFAQIIGNYEYYRDLFKDFGISEQKFVSSIIKHLPQPNLKDPTNTIIIIKSLLEIDPKLLQKPIERSETDNLFILWFIKGEDLPQPILKFLESSQN